MRNPTKAHEVSTPALSISLRSPEFSATYFDFFSAGEMGFSMWAPPSFPPSKLQ
jgi:hypothetical protein